MNKKGKNLHRQEDEFKALQAIFDDEVSDLRANGNEPLNFYITLKPARGSTLNEEDIHVELCLHVQCDYEYPYKIPVFSEWKSKGLSTKQTSDLLQELKILAKKKIGEEMIYDLAIFVKEYLIKFNNKPRFRSFHEEMLVLREEEKRRIEAIVTEQQETQRLAIQEELHRKREELKAELKAEGRQRKESWHYTRDPIICNVDASEPEEKMESPYNKKKVIIRNEVDQDDDMDEEDDDILIPCKAQSRFYSDFDIKKSLGRGAYGLVWKARNKIDCCDYAIKRIKLDPLNDKMQKRMQSEVRTLSRLDHENVVRYYTSWIEQYTIDREAFPIKKDGDTDYTDGSIPVTDVEVSHVGDVSDSESESDEHQWRAHYINEDSEYILFEDSHKDSTIDEVDSVRNGFSGDSDEGVTSLSSTPSTLKFMYIQMEFCEKSTLRTAIDDGLCYDVRRVWRLFREIVEGLAHIHSKNIMHRDLKPVNIFINSSDHVKIGDFGLAVITDLSRPFIIKDKETTDVPVGSSEMFTGLIGTALYVAPEVDSTAKRALYNKKVDIYSLGVIMFEMCYEPLETGMERTKVLTNLRLPQIKMPDNFPQDKLRVQTEVIRWLLDHNPAKRPTAEELLSSNLLPPAEVEDAHLQEMLRHAFSQETNSKFFKRLLPACFSQKLSAAKDAAYNASVPTKRQLSLPMHTALLAAVKEKILKVFHKHGASCIVTPLLIPRSSYQTSSTVHLMTQDGAIVSLPHDLRVSFARYVVYNKLTCMKRYAIQRVFRESKSSFVHPRELFECAFDIVTPSPGNLTADAELLAVVHDILTEFPHLEDTQIKIRLNHSELFRAMLLSCNVTDKRVQHELFTMSHEVVNNILLRQELHAKLVFLNVSETAISNFLTLFDMKNDFSKVSSTLKQYIRQKEAVSVLRKALRDLEMVVQNARDFGVDWTIQLCPSLLRGIMQYSGVMCDVIWTKPGRQNRTKVHILAAGGRYDAMLSCIGENLKNAEELKTQSAAGISLCMDRLVEMYGDSVAVGWLDAVVWAADPTIPAQKLTSIARSLWDGGVRCQVMDGCKDMAEIETFCEESGVIYMVVLRESDVESVRIRSLDARMVTENIVPVRELVDYLQRRIKSSSQNTPTDATSIPPPASRQDSRGSGGGDASSNTNMQSSNSWSTNWNISYISNEKGDRRRIKANIRKKLYNQVKVFDAKTNVEIISVPNLDFHCLNSLVGALDLDSEEGYDRSYSDVLSRTPPRQKEELSDVINAVRESHFKNCIPVILLYSISSSKLCVLLCD